MDDSKLVSHFIVRMDGDLLYLQLDSALHILVKRTLEPLDRFYTTSTACLAGEGLNLTIVAEVTNISAGLSQLWYMNSHDGGFVWSKYAIIPTPSAPGRLTYWLWCPLTYIKETKRLSVIFTVGNLSDPIRPHGLAIASRAPGSSVFRPARIFVQWPHYRSHYAVVTTYTSLSGVVYLHTVTYANDSLIYIRSHDNGLTWTLPVTVAAKTTLRTDAVQLVARRNNTGHLYLSYEGGYDQPVTLLMSFNNGNSWTKSYPLTEARTSGPISLRLCHDKLYNFVQCAAKTVCLYEWDLQMLVRTRVDSPFENYSDGLYGAYFACAYSQSKQELWMTALTNAPDEDYEYLMVSFNNTHAEVIS